MEPGSLDHSLSSSICPAPNYWRCVPSRVHYFWCQDLNCFEPRGLHLHTNFFGCNSSSDSVCSFYPESGDLLATLMHIKLSLLAVQLGSIMLSLSHSYVKNKIVIFSRVTLSIKPTGLAGPLGGPTKSTRNNILAYL